MLALLLIPLAVCAVTLLSQRAASPPVHAVAGRAMVAPSPLAVLCEFLRADRRPPSLVVQCAIAEAKLMGRNDLAYDLERTFGPAAHAQLAASMPSGVPAASPTPNASPGDPGDDPGDYDDEAQMRAAMVVQRAPRAPAPDAIAAPMPQSPTYDAGEIDLAIAPVPMIASSPIAGVDDRAWSQFCGALVREDADFVSQRNVGRYRHRKDRVAEIGMDPAALVGSIDAQDAALGADMADAYDHMARAGLTRHVGRAISIPDVDGMIPATLSGLLGIASVAGVEGCAGWLENKTDRKRFPHTTQAFLKTNGAF